NEEQKAERAPPTVRPRAQRERRPGAGDERQQARDKSGDEARVDRVARRAARGVSIVLPLKTCRQYAVPVLREARDNDDRERRDKDHSQNDRSEAPDEGAARQRPYQHRLGSQP